MDKVPNERIRQLCGVTKGVNKKINGINECVLQWLEYVQKMENDRITKRVYVGECTGSFSVGWSRKSGLIS